MKLIKCIFKIPYATYFLIFYCWEVILSNVQVAIEVITPKHNMTPGIVGIPLDTNNPIAINLLANLITMTPGTMSVEVSGDLKTLYVYGLHVGDISDFKEKIKTRLESRVIKLFE